MGRLGALLHAARAAFENPDLGRMQVSWTAMSFATWGFAIALGVYAFDLGGSTAVGVVAAIRLLPGVIATPFAGVLGDRHSRRQVLLGCTACDRDRPRPGRRRGGSRRPGGDRLRPRRPVHGRLQPLHPRRGGDLPRPRPHPAGALRCQRRPRRRRQPRLPAGRGRHRLPPGGERAGPRLRADRRRRRGGDPGDRRGAAGTAVPITSGPRRRAGSSPRPPIGARSILSEQGLRLAASAIVLISVFEGAADVLVVSVALQLLDLGRGSVGFLNALWGLGRGGEQRRAGRPARARQADRGARPRLPAHRRSPPR